MLILAINPGSTTTKTAVFEGCREIFKTSIAEDRGRTDQLTAQLPERVEQIHRLLRERGLRTADLSATVGRGGILPPLKSGGYLVCAEMLDDLKSGREMPHPSNLGAMLAYEIAAPLGIPAYIYDPISACCLSDMARVTGFREIMRNPKCHVLNGRATSRKCAEQHGRKFEETRFVVAHLGGGISISAIAGGEVVDVAGDDDGAFSPERSGSIPLLDLVELCFGGRFTKDEIQRKIRGDGGLRALLGTSDCTEIEKRIAGGDTYAGLIYEAQAYQIAKGIGIMSAALKFSVDYIILTGGMAFSKRLTGNIQDLVSPIAPVEIWPGENEMEALALGAYRILSGEEQALDYVSKMNSKFLEAYLAL